MNKKVVQKEQNTITLYHNCPKSALSSILKNGIKASYSINKNNLTHKEIADKVKKIPKVVYLGNKRMADGIGAYRKKHGYSKDDGVTLELKIPKKDYDNFKFVDNPECLGAKNLTEYIKIHNNMNSKISENELKQRWKVINPPYTITIANDIDPKYIVNKFKTGGNLKLIPKHEFGKILHSINPIEVFKKRAISKGADKAYINSIKKFNLKTESGRQAAAEYIAHLDGLLGKEAEEAIRLYKNFFKEESKNMREGASVDGAPIIHSQSRGTEYNTQLLDSHEMYHNLITRCLEPIPEAAINKKDLIDTDPRAIDPDYYINDNNNEVAARISLVLSAHGITDARKITGYELKQMFDNYLEADYLINDGIDFVASKVKNWDSLAKWANNPNNVYVIPALGITAAGTLAFASLNNQALFSKRGGNLKLIPKAEGGRKLLTKVFNDVFKGKSLKELSPQEWDTAYNYVLLKYGNKESNLLQKIRDYHFYTSAPDTVVRESSGKPIQVFHGSISPNIRKFKLDTPNNASMTGTLDKRIYFSDSKGIAALYAVDPEYKLALTIDHLADAVGLDKEGLKIIASQLKMPVNDVKKIVKDYEIGMNFVMRKTNQDDFIYPVYLNIRNHANVDLNGDIISRLSKEARAEINSKPGAIIRNVDETVTNLFGIRTAPSTDYLVQYPQQIKRSAAITYDTNGNIIPISLRDNFHNPDINYKVGGKLIPKKGGKLCS